MSLVTLADVQAARERIRSHVYMSPCARTETLSRVSGVHAYLKLENLQMTGAYKERGALNKLLTLTAAERERAGITEGLLRVSVGLEAIDDLKADLERGLAALKR